MSTEHVDAMLKVTTVGKALYDTFVEERFVQRTKSIAAPINKINLPLFSNHKAKPKPRLKGSLAALKNDCALFSRLYIACQTRDGNLDEFFKHENQPWPPSLSTLGDIRAGTKTDPLVCLTDHPAKTTEDNPAHCLGETDAASSTTGSQNEAQDSSEIPAEVLDDTIGTLLQDPPDELDEVLSEAVIVPLPDSTPNVDAKVLDGAAIVQMLLPKGAKTFEDYVDSIFLPYVVRNSEGTSRIDIVFDVYSSNSIKAATRERRGCGLRRRVLPKTSLPANWQSFLRVDDNKTELFQFIAQRLCDKAELEN